MENNFITEYNLIANKSSYKTDIILLIDKYINLVDSVYFLLYYICHHESQLNVIKYIIDYFINNQIELPEDIILVICNDLSDTRTLDYIISVYNENNMHINVYDNIGHNVLYIISQSIYLCDFNYILHIYDYCNLITITDYDILINVICNPHFHCKIYTIDYLISIFNKYNIVIIKDGQENYLLELVLLHNNDIIINYFIDYYINNNIYLSHNIIQHILQCTAIKLETAKKIFNLYNIIDILTYNNRLLNITHNEHLHYYLNQIYKEHTVIESINNMML